MHFSCLLIALPLVSATVLVKYSAADGDAASVLGLENLNGYDDSKWPSGQAQNSSLYFKTATDPDGVPAAHVHKEPHFTRAEYHSLNGKTQAEKTYYIGYHVRWDAVDYHTIVMQWKNYNADTVPTDDIPVDLLFGHDADGANNHTVNLRAIPDPTSGPVGKAVWTKKLEMGNAYRFGLVVDTSQSNGYIQWYFQGKLATLTDPANGAHTQKLAGNFWPGSHSDPKFGMYGGVNNLRDDAYIYDVVIGTQLSDIAEVAGIAL